MNADLSVLVVDGDLLRPVAAQLPISYDHFRVRFARFIPT
jgi:hypothetical protein